MWKTPERARSARTSGDDNRNAKVEAVYRKRGKMEWRGALALLRLQNEEIGVGRSKDW